MTAISDEEARPRYAATGGPPEETEAHVCDSGRKVSHCDELGRTCPCGGKRSSLLLNYSAAEIAPVRVDMHVAVCVNLASLFVVINGVSP
jgi:hypothetical protein